MDKKISNTENKDSRKNIPHVQKVKVSVIVPVYNVDQYLRECMDSLVHQTLKEIEIICVNDGSTDQSLSILEEYARSDARVKIISKENAGYGHTMNVGIDAASGKYIGIVEPDDYVRRDMYRRLYEVAEKLDLDLVKADFYRFRGTGNETEAEYHHLSKDTAYYRKVIDPKEHVEIFKFIMNTWTGIYKRAFINEHHIRHNETPGASFQDNGFWFQTFCWAKRVYFLDEPFYMYRRDNPGSSVHDRGKVYSVCEEYAFIRHFLEQNPELKKRYLYMYSLKRFHNYQFTMQRIGRERQKEFLKRYSRDFRQAEAAGELAQEYFARSDWRILHEIMYTPGRYLWKYRRKGNVWYKIHYYLENYGLAKTISKIMETLAGQMYKTVKRYGKDIRNHTCI